MSKLPTTHARLLKLENMSDRFANNYGFLEGVDLVDITLFELASALIWMASHTVMATNLLTHLQDL